MLDPLERSSVQAIRAAQALSEQPQPLRALLVAQHRPLGGRSSARQKEASAMGLQNGGFARVSPVNLIASRLRVLGQPLRVRLIDHLDRSGEAHVQALADELAATQQNTSKHLGALWRAGVVTRRQEGR